MSRGLASAVKTLLAQDEFHYVDLLELHFDVVRKLTDGPFDIILPTGSPTISGTDVSYSADGMWLGYSNSGETGIPRVNQIKITMSGADSDAAGNPVVTYANIALNQEYLNKRCVIYRQFMDNTNTKVSDPVMIWDGEIVASNIRDSNTDSVIEFTSSNVFYDFDMVQCRRTNSASQQQYFPQDKGFDSATQDITDVRWGRKI
jgi:hypothetical protein